MKPLRILLAGEIVPGSRTLQRIRALREMGHEVAAIETNMPGATYEDRPRFVERVRYKLRIPGDPNRANEALIANAGQQRFDLVWLERCVAVRAGTLRRIKELAPATRLVWYAEDDMMNPRHLSRWTRRALPLFDFWVTTKSMNAKQDEMPRLGVRNILFVNNSFDPDLHRPVTLSADEARRFACDVSFVGTFAAARAASMAHLAANGISVSIWGNGWDRAAFGAVAPKIMGYPVYDDEYAKVVTASKINLGFLRKENRDLQTCRSMELPAIGGFMMHERNSEICGLFEEGKEAVFFGDDNELLDNCRNWLAAGPERDMVAAAGRRRVAADGHSHAERLQQILEAAMDVSLR
ncbi:MAG: glycosyltransferase [Rhodospirillaceae bacterium]|nr:glycosyltransferase [Rhodospirillaceae bacterium]